MVRLPRGPRSEGHLPVSIVLQHFGNTSDIFWGVSQPRVLRNDRFYYAGSDQPLALDP